MEDEMRDVAMSAMENLDFDSSTDKEDRAIDYSRKLMEEHKREKEVALARILQLERELDQKKKLEFEIVQLRGKLKVIEHYLHGEEDAYKLIDEIHKKREEEKKCLEELHDGCLMGHTNQRLNEAHAELIEDYRSKDLLQHTIDGVFSASQKATVKANDLIFSQFHQINIDVASECPTSPLLVTKLTSTYPNSSFDELFLWPWVGILVNLPMEDEDVSLKEQFSEFNPINIIASLEKDLVSRKGEAVIMFSRDSRGFKDAMTFENHFKLKRMGKKEWYEKKDVNFIGIHGWIAHDDDYNPDRLIAKILRKHGEMKVADVMKGVQDNGMIMAALVKKMDVMDKYLQELKYKNNEMIASLKNIVDSKAKILQDYTEEMHNVKQTGRENARRNLMENDKLKLELGMKKNEIKQCCRELQKYEDKNDGVKRNLAIEKEKAALANNYLELVLIEKKTSDEKGKKLMEERERENEVALARVFELERELDQKQKLELEIAHLKGKLKVMEHLQRDKEDIDKKIEEIYKKWEEDKEGLVELHTTLLLKEHEANQELHEARVELIQGLPKLLKGPSLIGIKRMGDLDIKPFISACKKMFPAEDVDAIASETCSRWVERIRDPSWHPFKIIKRDGFNEEVIDENDSKLKSLWIDFGDGVYNVVKKALVEMNEYNPVDRYPVAELWNKEEDRKAKLKEVIHYITKQIKTRR